MNRNLMIPVEKIVRPILASSTSKMRMREELYSHLEAIFLEELEVTEDEASALSQALTRFGDLDALRHDLQGTIPNWQQQTARFDAIFKRDSGETPSNYTFRMARLTAKVFGLKMLAVTLPGICWASFRGLALWPLMMCSIEIWLMGIVSVTAGVFIGQPLIDSPVRQLSVWKLLRNGAAFGMIVALTESILLLLWQFVATDAINLYLLQMTGRAFLGSAAIFTIVIALMRHELGQLSEWRSLKLTD